jgi:uncharacterized protein (TIGR00661 family)
MKILFIVQGEGRGHLTQALSLKQQLVQTNHEVVACLIGLQKAEPFTINVKEKLNIPVHLFPSPNLAYNTQNAGLSLRKTLLQNIACIPEYVQSLNKIKHWIRLYKPDLIVNFYDSLAGIYQLINPFSAPPMICIAHQYLLLHPDFEFPQGRLFDRFLINVNTYITSLRAKKMLALSIHPVKSSGKIVSIPPLLREEVLNEKTSKNDYYLAYFTNPELLIELKEWQSNHSAIEIHCFIKHNEENEVLQLQKNLFIHKLDSVKFLKMMAGSKGLITTAGFESVCEAIYLEKPVMMVPVPKHFEQACNAKDAERLGAGIARNNFVLDDFLKYAESYNSNLLNEFKSWLQDGRIKMLHEFNV